jgi:hypothetical protein
MEEAFARLDVGESSKPILKPENQITGQPTGVIRMCERNSILDRTETAFCIALSQKSPEMLEVALVPLLQSSELTSISMEAAPMSREERINGSTPKKIKHSIPQSSLIKPTLQNGVVSA